MACPSVGISIKPTLTRFIYYKLLTLVPVSAAITAMVRHSNSWVWPVLYVGACLTHAAVMNAAKCPHCPYYRNGDRTFECFIWWGTPKLWQDREGPEAGWVGKYAAFGMAVLTFFPVFWLLREWPLLLIYVCGIGSIILSIGLNECARCLNFECGHCGVADDLKKEYLTTFG